MAHEFWYNIILNKHLQILDYTLNYECQIMTVLRVFKSDQMSCPGFICSIYLSVPKTGLCIR